MGELELQVPMKPAGRRVQAARRRRRRGTQARTNGTTAADQSLRGLHIRFALYDGELAHEVERDEWWGYDIDLVRRLAETGGFTYELVSMGRNGVNFSSYSKEAERFLFPKSRGGADLADVMGNPTWRVLESRLPWAVFSNGYVPACW